MDRVAVFSWHNYWSYGGVQSFTDTLCSEAANANAPLRFVSAPEDVCLAAVALHNNGLSREAFLARAVQWLHESKARCLYSHNAHFGAGASLANILEKAAADAGVPHALFIHDMTGDDAIVNGLRNLGSTRIATQSEFNRRKIEILAGVQASVLPVGIDFNRFAPHPLPESFAIASPGRLCPAKGILEAVGVAGKLSEQLGELRLLLSNALTQAVGQTSQYLHSLASEAARHPALRVQCMSASDDVLSIYAKSAVSLLLPTGEEGFGLTALESLASGRPVVVKPAGGLSEWLQGLPGIAIVGDRDSAVERLSEIYAAPQIWHSAALEARSLLRRRYDAAPMAESHREFLQKVIKL